MKEWHKNRVRNLRYAYDHSPGNNHPCDLSDEEIHAIAEATPVFSSIQEDDDYSLEMMREAVLEKV